MQPESTALHWTSNKFSQHILMDALIKHVLGLMLYGMSDLGEVLEAVGQLKGGDPESWLKAWSTRAQLLQERAEKADRMHKSVSAASAYLRASTYWRVALMCFSEPDDSRMVEYSHASANCYERYLKLSGYPGTYVEIPYEDTFLPGHFYKSSIAGEKAPLLIITPGRDTWAEDTRWVYDAALRRGVHCLIYDGPGQGYALRLNQLVFRPDWENVMTPVVDFALTLPGIDPARIGSMGLSFGGFLSVRAAAFEPRLKALIADPGTLSWGEGIGRVLQSVSHLPSHELPPHIRQLVSDYAWKHGVEDSLETVIRALQAYDNTAVADKISCQTLVLDGTEEMAKGQAQQLFDTLKCPKHYLLFDGNTTAQAHCQIGAYATASEYLFDWLDTWL